MPLQEEKTYEKMNMTKYSNKTWQNGKKNKTSMTLNNSTITQPLEVTETIQELPKSTNNSELMLDTTLQLEQIEEQDTTRGSLEINTQVTNPLQGRIDDDTLHKKTQTQATIEFLDKKIDQVTIGLNPNTNSSEMELIDLIENRLMSPQVTEAGAPDPKVNTSVQQEAPEGTPILVYM
ncbi:8563_t:CDS:2 [Gigaspora margarita]|uniref:8563_t:CDS:1 n=1 Tax=Gigaspora margarita TaxID=4874 RepID=A0ABN7VWM4_GIGMA|nr:8563_t:CDS:2 [Gigaspora margarita]